MRTRGVVLAVLGLAGLGLVVASAFLPWYEWTLAESGVETVEWTGLLGPFAFVRGTPYGSVEMAGSGVQMVSVSVIIYLVGLVLSLGMVAVVWLPVLSPGMGRRRAVLVVSGGSVLLGIVILILLGFPGFALLRLAPGRRVTSTRLITAEMEGIRPAGPASLLVGIVVQAVARARSVSPRRA